MVETTTTNNSHGNASGSKRRDSNASNMLGLMMEACDDVILSSSSKGSTRKSLGRRRSSKGAKDSSGKSPSWNLEKQAKLAQMYSRIIQMSNENKINDKNSWSLDLIDHIGELVRDETNDRGEKGVNFQKASCTIDASIKIYTHRVDDTYNSSIRIMANLRGNIQDCNDEVDDADAEEGTGGEKAVKKTTKRNYSDKTIEKNPENLNAVKIESEHIADPLFHRMSKAFDEGGAKGMLMTNLRVSSSSSTIYFNCDTMTSSSNQDTLLEAPITEESKSKLIEVSDLIYKSGFTYEDLVAANICSTLDIYREQIGVPVVQVAPLPIPDTIHWRKVSRKSELYSRTGIPLMSAASEGGRGVEEAAGEAGGAATITPTLAPSHNLHLDGDDDNNNDMYCGGEADYGDDDNGSVSLSELGGVGVGAGGDHQGIGTPVMTRINWESVSATKTSRRSSVMPSLLSLDSEVTGELLPDAAGDAGGDNSAVTFAHQAVAAVVAPFNTVVVTTEADFAPPFVADSSRKSNAWAGARHWKYNLKARNIGQTDEFDEGSGTVKSSKKRGKTPAKPKAKEGLDFTSEIPAAFFELAKPVRARADPSLMTAGALAKLQQANSALQLPEDAKLDIQDLCRLFLRPSVKVAPPGLRHIVTQTSVADKTASCTSTHNCTMSPVNCEEEELFWGETRSSSTTKLNISQLPNLANDLDDWYDDDDNDNDGGEGGYIYEDNAAAMDETIDNLTTLTLGDSQPGRTGLDIDTSKLLRAGRVISKVRIGHATAAKRVNVRKLKSDMWNSLDRNCYKSKLLQGSQATGGDADSENRTPFRRSINMVEAAEEETAAGGAVPASESWKLSGTGKSQSQSQGSMSFQSLVAEIANKQCQDDVTLPYYFICLLHLANEKTLRIVGDSSLADLRISKD